MKKYVLTGAIFVSTLLLGAGCAPQAMQNTATAPDNTVMNTSTNNVVPTNITQSTGDGMTLTVTPTGVGTVQISWTMPSGTPADARVRVINSRLATQEPGTGAYYYDLLANHGQFTWSNVPSGARLFRMCLLSADNSCVSTTTPVTVTVP